MLYKTNIKLKGMTCHACEELVKMQFEELDGVETVMVSLASQIVEIQAQRKITLEDAKKVLTDTHYSVNNLE